MLISFTKVLLSYSTGFPNYNPRRWFGRHPDILSDPLYTKFLINLCHVFCKRDKRKVITAKTPTMMS